MNKVAMLAGAAGAAALFAGCGPDLAQVEYGSEEARWQQVIRDNYSGYEAPRTAPPAVVDNVSPRLIEEEQLRKGQSDEAGVRDASDDPGAAVDKAADTGNAGVKENDSAAPSDGKQADDKKADGKQADGKQADGKPADDKKAAADKQADGKKAAKKVDGDIYEVVAGDTLGKIAKQFYGDARRFDIIVNANEQLKADPDKLRVGMKLVIPKI